MSNPGAGLGGCCGSDLLVGAGGLSVGAGFGGAAGLDLWRFGN